MVKRHRRFRTIGRQRGQRTGKPVRSASHRENAKFKQQDLQAGHQAPLHNLQITTQLHQLGLGSTKRFGVNNAD